jgi:hypothetical protein
MEPWQYYLDELQRRTERIPPRAFGRAELVAEAAHDAYQATANHLTAAGWHEEDALTVTRMFGQAVKQWLAADGESWDQLRNDLNRRYAEWTASDRTQV